MRTILSKTLLCSSLLFVGANADTDTQIEQKVASAILKSAKKYSIDPRVLFTVIDIESAFNPNAICVETKSRKSAEMLKLLASDNIKIRVGKTYHSRVYMVSIFPKREQDALLMSEMLKKLHFSYDAGLMQINSVNFGKHEATKIFDPAYNIDKGTKILKGCMQKFKKFVHQVECYNRGAGNLIRSIRKGKKYYPYYKQYLKKWSF